MRWETIAMPVGEQSDFLLFDFGAAQNMNLRPDFGLFIYGWTLAAPAPSFGWTLYLRHPTLMTEVDIVVLDSIDAIPETVVAPIAAQVVNRTMQCKRVVEASRSGGLPMQLRVTTQGKVGAGMLYLKWAWEPVPT